MKFIIASFDGLRPDLISPELTPNIARVKAVGTTLSAHRTVYPSETRAAFAPRSLCLTRSLNPSSIIGCVLQEATAATSEPFGIAPEARETGLSFYRQTLHRVWVYLDGATAADAVLAASAA